MLELTGLKFSVETGELKQAVVELNKVRTAWQGLTKEQTKAAEGESKAAASASKAREAQTKAELAAIKLSEVKQKAVASATKSVTEETDKLTKYLQRVEDRLGFVQKGFTVGQATQLAYAKSLGAVNAQIDETGKLLDRQNRLTGKNPFDDSLGPLKAVQNELKKLNAIQRLTDQGLDLSKKQMEQLVIARRRLVSGMLSEGSTLSEIRNSWRTLTSEYTRSAEVTTKLADSQERGRKSILETAKANQYIETSMQKAAFAAGHMQDALNTSTTNGLFKFERALKISGKTVEEQTRLLNQYKNAVLAAEKAAAQKKVDYVSRAVAPQLTDIMVGLATGQSPLQVALQQGGQLRDQFGLAGIAAADMASVMRTAATSMISSIGATVVAMGKFVYGTLKDLPFMVGRGILSLTGLNRAFSAVIAEAKAWDGVFAFAGIPMVNLGKLATMLTTTLSAILVPAIVAAIVVLGLFAYEMYKLMKASTDLNQAVVQSGASLRTTEQSFATLATTMSEKTGKSMSSILTIFGEIAKAGVFTAEQLEQVGIAAILMEKYVDVAVKDTVALFKKLKEDPTEAVLAFAKANGQLSIATLEQVRSLQLQGRSAEAAAIAIKAASDASVRMAKDTFESMSPLEKVWINFKEGIAGGTNALTRLLNTEVAAKIIEWTTPLLALVKTLQLLSQTGVTIKVNAEQTANAFTETIKEAFKDGKVSTAAKVLGTAVAGAVIDGLVDGKKQIADAFSSVQTSAADIRRVDAPQARADTLAMQAKQAEALAYWAGKEADALTGVQKAQRELTLERGKYNEMREQGNLKGQALELANIVILDRERKLAKAIADEKAASIGSLSDVKSTQYDSIKKSYELQLSLVTKYEKENLDRIKAGYDSDELTLAVYLQNKAALLRTSSAEQQSILADELVGLTNARKAYYDNLEKQADKQAAFIASRRLPKAEESAELQKLTKDLALAKEVFDKNHTDNVERIAAMQALLNTRLVVDEQQAFAEFAKGLKLISKELEDFNKEEQKRQADIAASNAAESKMLWATPEQATRIKAVADATKAYTSDIAKFILIVAKAKKEYDSLFVDDGQGGILGDPESPQAQAAMKAWIEARKNLEHVVGTQRIAEEKAAIDSGLKYEEQERKRLYEGITDSIVTALFEGGQAGSKKLRDLIVAELKKPITLFIQAQVQSLFGGGSQGGSGLFDSLFKNLTGGNASGSGGDISSDAPSYLSELPGSTTQGSGSQGLFSGLFQQMGGFLKNIPILGDLFSKIGSALPSLGPVLGAIGIGATLGNLIANGFEIFKGSGAVLGGIGGAIGMIFGGPIGSAIGAAIGGLLNRAFGRKLKEVGFQAEYSSAGVTGNNYRFEEGGWFRSDKTTLSTLDPEIQGFLDKGTGSIIKALKEFGILLGISSDAFEAFTFSFKLNFKDMKEDEIQQAMQDLMNDFATAATDTLLSGSQFATYFNDFKAENPGADAEAVIKFVGELAQVFVLLQQQSSQMRNIFGQVVNLDDIYALRKEGEAIGEVFKRLLNVFVTTNIVAQTLGKTSAEAFGAVGLASTEARERLVRFAGGIEALNSSLDSYLTNFFSEAERQAFSVQNAMQALTSGFSELGMVMPTTRAGFRALVESIDVSTEEGARLYAALMLLAPAMATVAAATPELVSELMSLAGMARDSIKSLFETVLSEATSAEDARIRGEKAASEMFFNSMMQMMLDKVTSMVMQGIVDPMATNLVGAAQMAGIETRTSAFTAGETSKIAALQAATVTETSAITAGTNIAVSGVTAGTNVALGGQIAGTSVQLGGMAAGQSIIAGAFGLTAVIASIVDTIGLMTQIVSSPEFQQAYAAFTAAIGQVSAALYVAMPQIPGYSATPPDNSGNGLAGESGTNNALRNAYEILVAAINKQKELVEKQLALVNAIYDATVSAVKTLRGDIESVQGATYKASRLFLKQAGLDIANGILPDADKYKEAVTNAVNGVQRQTYASLADEQKAKALLAVELQNIADTLKPQKTALEQQLEYLNGLLETAKMQYDALQGNTLAVMSLAQAIANWAAVSGYVLPAMPITATGSQAANEDSYGLRSGVTIPKTFNGEGNSAELDELRALREELVMLRAETRAIVSTSGKTAKILDRVSQGSDTFKTEAA